MISPIEECATFQNLQIWISFSFFLTPFTASDFNRVFCIVWKILVVSWVVVFCQPPCEMASVLPLALHLDFYWRLSLKRNTVANLEDSIKIRYACMSLHVLVFMWDWVALQCTCDVHFILNGYGSIRFIALLVMYLKSILTIDSYIEATTIDKLSRPLLQILLKTGHVLLKRCHGWN